MKIMITGIPDLNEYKSGGWIKKATKNMRTDKPCTGSKFGGPTCPSGSKRYNLAKTFKAMHKKEDGGKISLVKKEQGGEIQVRKPLKITNRAGGVGPRKVIVEKQGGVLRKEILKYLLHDKINP